MAKFLPQDSWEKPRVSDHQIRSLWIMGQYSIVPNSIMSGFKRSGIYFFNPKALNHGANGSSSCVISGSSSSANDGSSSVKGNSIGDFGCLSANIHYGLLQRTTMTYWIQCIYNGWRYISSIKISETVCIPFTRWCYTVCCTYSSLSHDYIGTCNMHWTMLQRWVTYCCYTSSEWYPK